MFFPQGHFSLVLQLNNPSHLQKKGDSLWKWIHLFTATRSLPVSTRTQKHELPSNLCAVSSFLWGGERLTLAEGAWQSTTRSYPNELSSGLFGFSLCQHVQWKWMHMTSQRWTLDVWYSHYIHTSDSLIKCVAYSTGKSSCQQLSLSLLIAGLIPKSELTINS